MINWKKEGIANSVVALLIIGPMFLMVMIINLADIVSKSPTFYTILLYTLCFLCISLLIYSKLPNILSGNYLTFGLKHIVNERRKYYKASYVLGGINILLALSIMLAIEFYRL